MTRTTPVKPHARRLPEKPRLIDNEIHDQLRQELAAKRAQPENVVRLQLVAQGPVCGITAGLVA